jgi:hypothetical protein
MDKKTKKSMRSAYDKNKPTHRRDVNCNANFAKAPRNTLLWHGGEL